MYPGYTRVHNSEYLKALLKVLQEDAVDLIEIMGLGDMIKELSDRIHFPESFSTAAKLTKGILKEAGAKSPLMLSADEFNLAAEKYYRETLRKNLIAEAFSALEAGLDPLDSEATGDFGDALHFVSGREDMILFIRRMRDHVIDERATEEDLRKLIYFMLIEIRRGKQINAVLTQEQAS